MIPNKILNQLFTEEENKQKMEGHIIPLSPVEKVIYNGKPQRELHRRYGDPREKGWGNKWMSIWQIKRDFPWFPAEKIYIHKDFKEKLTRAFKVLEAAELHKEIKTFDGCYCIRTVRGTDSLMSVHSWGCAIDLNAKLNPLGAEAHWSHDFISVMEHCGIFCGSRWHGRPDPMHFALVNG
jgi:hypothetical protein